MNASFGNDSKRSQQYWSEIARKMSEDCVQRSSDILSENASSPVRSKLVPLFLYESSIFSLNEMFGLVLARCDFDDRRLASFADVLRIDPSDPGIISFAFASLSRDNRMISVMNLFTNPLYSGHRFACSLLFQVLAHFSAKLGDHVHSSMVELDDTTAIDPPTNLYFRLGFEVFSDSAQAFVSWKEWLRTDFDFVERPNPDERRRMLTTNLLDSLCFFVR